MITSLPILSRPPPSGFLSFVFRSFSAVPQSNRSPEDISSHLHQAKSALLLAAKHLGLSSVAITEAHPARTQPQFEDWIEKGYNGEMQYLGRPDRLIRRRDLSIILPGVKSVVLVTQSYFPGLEKFPSQSENPKHGNVSCYAWGTDYHKIIGDKLAVLAKLLHDDWGADCRWFVDTGAVNERDLAARAGLGFRGKNTMLIHPKAGSGFFIGEILTTLPLPPDSNPKMTRLEDKRCGACRKCLDLCPTQAFVRPFVLDARLCISYLTIELKGSIPLHLRRLIGNHIYGCDVCQTVCPWNRADPHLDSPLWGPVAPEVAAPVLTDLIRMDDHQFEQRFRHSPIFRIKRSRFLRNVAVALGNSGDASAIPVLEQVLHCESDPLILEHVQWALDTLRATTASNATAASTAQNVTVTLAQTEGAYAQ